MSLRSLDDRGRRGGLFEVHSGKSNIEKWKMDLLKMYFL